MPDTTGARVTMVPRNFVQRVVDGARYAISGVTPQTWFGPGQPVRPVPPAEAQVAGRAYDFPFGANLQYGPRSVEPTSFSDLRALAECDIVRLLIETRKDQLEAQNWEVRPKKTADGKTPAASAFAGEIKTVREWMESPDKVHDLQQWIRILAEDLFVIDAPTLYKRRDRKGRIYGFEVIDGATITPLVDANGRTPLAPSPAYQQILHGTVASDYTVDDLIYYPRNPRPHKVYGFPPVEQIILTINTLMRRNLHQLAFYTEGNMTDAMFTAPTGWSQDQITGWQKYWNSLFAGNVGARRQGIWVPNGTDVKQPKAPVLKDPYDEFLARVACFCFSISPQPFVSQFNRATAESAKEQSTEEGLLPLLNYYRRLFAVLLRHQGFPMLEIAPVDDRETDPSLAAEIDDKDNAAGRRTINEVRIGRGWEPSPDPAADVLMVRTPSGYVPISDALKPKEPAPQFGHNGGPPLDGEGDKPGSQNDAVRAEEPDPAKKMAKAKDSDPAVVDLTAQMVLDRPVSRAARKAVAARYEAAFAKTGAALSKTLRSALTKAANDDLTRLIEAAEAFDYLDYLSDAGTGSAEDFAAAAADAGQAALLRLGITDGDAFNHVNARAVTWADGQAAELVTQIDTATKNMLRQAITTAMADGMTAEQVADAIAEAVPFSAERAAFIAETEIANANGAGALVGLKEAAGTGLNVNKTWLLGPEPCVVCIANAAEGAIPLDHPFLSGDMAPLAHPRCRCALGHSIAEETKPVAVAA